MLVSGHIYKLCRPDFAADHLGTTFLVTSLMHGPSKCPWFKVTSVYRCFERFQASFHERREDEVPHQVNYQPGEEHMARHSSRPILGFRATRRVDRGYGTARADTNLFFPYLPACFPCFSLCFRYSSQSSAKIHSELPASQPLTKFLGIQITS